MKYFFMLFIAIIISMQTALAAEPILTIASFHTVKQFSRSSLLASNHVEKIIMRDNRAYPGKKMQLEAVKLCTLLKSFNIDPDNMIELIAADGFSVYVPAKKLLTCNANSAVAYLAIEPATKWPLLDNGTNTTAGPFEVIWLHPEKSYISNEYWAWSVVRIAVHRTVDKELLKLKPVHANAQVKHGYEIYVSHCAGCHTINHIGKAVIGPDLKKPKSIFAYYPDHKTLKKFIRDPQFIRPGRMSGSGEDFLNDADLEALIAYLKKM